MKQVWIAAGLFFLVILLFGIWGLAAVTKSERKLGADYFGAVDPTGVSNIQNHIERWGHPTAIYRRSVSGTNIYIFCGLTNKLPAASPSGPPAYVYGEHGSFLDWFPDLGDDPKAHARWSNLWPHDPDEKMTDEQFDRLFSTNYTGAKSSN